MPIVNSRHDNVRQAATRVHGHVPPMAGMVFDPLSNLLASAVEEGTGEEGLLLHLQGRTIGRATPT